MDASREKNRRGFESDARESVANKTGRSRESVNTRIRTVIHTCVERFERRKHEGTRWKKSPGTGEGAGGRGGGKGMDTRIAGGWDRRGGFNHVK